MSTFYFVVFTNLLRIFSLKLAGLISNYNVYNLSALNIMCCVQTAGFVAGLYRYCTDTGTVQVQDNTVQVQGNAVLYMYRVTPYCTG